ncbi:hypothetical protein [Clostridium thailandense]|uniref:hypothetical protein n=1 Tax=Clostridium thailandense TaxID=2794346 RepID=UPI003988DA03
MKIDQLQQLKTNGIQQTNINKVSTNDNSIFSKKLEELMQSVSSQNNSDSINNNALETLINTIVSQNNSSSTSGLDSLGLQPDKISRMMELLSSNNSASESQKLSLANALNIDDSSDDDSVSSDSSALGIGNIMGEGSDMTQLLQAVMESQNASSTTNENTQSKSKEQQKNEAVITSSNEV